MRNAYREGRVQDRDAFRLWEWAQERRDAAVFWGCIVLAGIAIGLPEAFR